MRQTTPPVLVPEHGGRKPQQKSPVGGMPATLALRSIPALPCSTTLVVRIENQAH